MRHRAPKESPMTKKVARDLYATIERTRETLLFIRTQYTAEEQANATAWIAELEAKITACRQALEGAR
jgi:hypothetical protein